jgi:hypothetical protein
MTPIRRKIQRLLVLFVFGVLALNYPLLALFSKTVLWFGIPLLYLYLFVFWLVFIMFIAFVAERKKMPRTSFPLTFKRKAD